MKISLLIALLCSVLLSPAVRADSSGDLRQIEQYLRCFDDLKTRDACVTKLADENTPFARVERGSALLWKQGSEAERAANRKQALADFHWAADQGYPPGVEGIGLAYQNQDNELWLEWIQKSIEQGMGESANYLMNGHGVGSDLEAAVNLTFYSWLGCHPAALRDTNELYRMWEFGKANGIGDFNTLIARYRASKDQEMKKQKEWFLERCAKNTYYFGYALSPTQVRTGMLRAREKLRQTLQRIKIASEKFPELRLLTRPEYFDLLPDIDESTAR